MTLFWKLCKDGNLEGVRECLAREVDINRVSGGSNIRNSGLMMAAFKKHNSVVRFLLEQPTVDLNSTDPYGRTALHWAVNGGNVEGVQLLLGNGRFNTANHRDNGGMTPVMAAVNTRSLDVLRVLVAHQSVDLDLRDLQGNSLEERARWAEQFQCERHCEHLCIFQG